MVRFKLWASAYAEDGPCIVLGLTQQQAVSRTKASSQSMTMLHVVTRFEDEDNFEYHTPSMVMGRVRSENHLCITGTEIGKLAFELDPWVVKWQRWYDKATSPHDLGNYIAYIANSIAFS